MAYRNFGAVAVRVVDGGGAAFVQYGLCNLLRVLNVRRTVVDGGGDLCVGEFVKLVLEGVDVADRAVVVVRPCGEAGDDGVPLVAGDGLNLADDADEGVNVRFVVVGTPAARACFLLVVVGREIRGCGRGWVGVVLERLEQQLLLLRLLRLLRLLWLLWLLRLLRLLWLLWPLWPLWLLRLLRLLQLLWLLQWLRLLLVLLLRQWRWWGR